MIHRDWTADAKILRLFQSIGRASLLYDIQDSHSGNMAVKVRGPGGEDQIFITATGSQKGDLEPEQICCLSATETDYGYYKASSETDIHARILALPGRGRVHARPHQGAGHRHARRRAAAQETGGFRPDRSPRLGYPRRSRPCRLVRRAERLARDDRAAFRRDWPSIP